MTKHTLHLGSEQEGSSVSVFATANESKTAIEGDLHLLRSVITFYGLSVFYLPRESLEANLLG